MPILNPLEELRRRLHTLPRWSPVSVVTVIGSGVSIQATKGMLDGAGQASSWKGLLRLAVLYIDRLKKKPRGWEPTALMASLTNERIKVAELLAVANTVENALRSAGAVRDFFDEAVGCLQPVDTEVLRALGQLGTPMATTNYDGLIEWVHELQALTWRHSAAVDEWFTGAQPGVLHLHGHFRAPDSIVLGRASYKEALKDGHAQNVLRNLFQQRTLLFVGMGGGLDDPNFSALLDWAIDSRLPTDCFHVLLLREPDARNARARYPVESGIRVLSYGVDYSDLALYLRGLLRSSQLQINFRPAVTLSSHAGNAQPDRRSIRQEIATLLRSSTDLEAFCLDHFPHVFHQFTRGMTRTQQETLLLSRDEDLAKIQAELSTRIVPADLSLNTRNTRPLATSSAAWRSLGSLQQRRNAVFTALFRLDRKSQWRAIRHDLSLFPIANRLVVLRAHQRQSLTLFVRRIEHMLTEPDESGNISGTISARHVPLRLEQSTADTPSIWTLHLMQILASYGGSDSGHPAERLAEAAAAGHLVLSLVETVDPLRLLRALPAKRQEALRSFLCDALPAYLSRVDGVTVLLPVELLGSDASAVRASSPNEPLWPAVQTWLSPPGAPWLDISTHPAARQRCLYLDELHAPTWEDVEDYFWHHDPPLPSPNRLLDAMRPIFDRLHAVETTYEQIATAIDDLISDHT